MKTLRWDDTLNRKKWKRGVKGVKERFQMVQREERVESFLNRGDGSRIFGAA